MSSEKKYLIVGLVLGMLVSVLFFTTLAPRYNTINSGTSLVKQDTWTGRSWRLVENEWKPIIGMNREWEKIDEALQGALKIPVAEVKTDSAMKLLRTKYSILGDLSDEELLERIKLVYSRQVLCNLYLDSFMKVQEQEQAAKDATTVK
ncbi:MAG: hypothetical protein C4576_29865 [Desulfobacteraceae bacterium]|nr:MAG: hypothetical protein C4576_29865 [Desulfobacteraceae bacterium]